MNTVLFVDDEQDILDGMKRILRPLRRQWEMLFVCSAAEALEILEKEPVNIVVTDMRMPEMDGAQLLTIIKKKFPKIIRIVLSGHSDQEMVLQSAGIAHQYLAKPCDAETLVHVLARSSMLREILHASRLERLVSDLTSVPSLPSLYQEIMEVLKSPDPSIAKIGEIVQRDVGMTAKILQLINSAFFGLPRHVSSPAQAVALLGCDVIKALVFSIQIFSQFDPALVKQLRLENVWDHSVNVSAWARLLSIEAKTSNIVADQAYLAGIMHDVGKLVLAVNMQKLYAEFSEKIRETPCEEIEREMEVFGVTHAEVGAYLLGLWGLPDPIVEAVAYHHDPRKSGVKTFVPLVAVHMANALDHTEQHPVCKQNLDKEFLQSLTDFNATECISNCQKRIREAREHEAENSVS